MPRQKEEPLLFDERPVREQLPLRVPPTRERGLPTLRREPSVDEELLEPRRRRGRLPFGDALPSFLRLLAEPGDALRLAQPGGRARGGALPVRRLVAGRDLARRLAIAARRQAPATGALSGAPHAGQLRTRTSWL
jgi:hypothetical protein